MRILGIEFGAWSVKAVEMESRFRRVEILDFHEVRLPLEILDPLPVYRDAVSKLLARMPSAPEKIATSVPPAQTALRFLQMPVKQRKVVEKMYRFELEDAVPLRIEDALLEHQVYRRGEGSLVFVAMAPKNLVRSHLEWLQAVGIDPDWLTFDGMGLLNLYFAQTPLKGPEAPEDPVLLLDIGHAKTNLAICHQGRLEHFRSISWGGGAITRKMAQSLGLTLEDAEKMKHETLALDAELDDAPGPMQDAVLAAGQACGTFATDLMHTLVSYRNATQKEVRSAVISGGTSKLRGMSSLIATSLGIPVQPFSAFKGENLKEELRENADESRFGEPLGRASVFLRKTSLLFNFRKQELAKETSLDEVSALVQNPLVVKVMGYFALLAALLYFNSWVVGWLATGEVSTAQSELQKTFQDTFPGVPSKMSKSLTTDSAQLEKYIQQKEKDLAQKIKMLSRDKSPMLSRVLAVSAAFPPEVKVDVNTLLLDDRSLSIEGVLYEGTLDKVKDGLSKITWLKEITETKDGQRFTVKAQVVQP
ncbi:pilus assembly protein PilM [bacterium]|nr:pilus assembly protein PilM [bacterium]